MPQHADADQDDTPGDLSDAIAANVAAADELEDKHTEARTPLERASHAVGAFVASLAFVLANGLILVAWVAINSGKWPSLVFDPFPYNFLGTLMSFEAVIMTAFVLIRQDRIGARAEHRARLDLQVNLLTEREATRILQLLHEVARKAGIDPAVDAEAAEMLEPTEVHHVARHLRAENGPA